MIDSMARYIKIERYGFDAVHENVLTFHVPHTQQITLGADAQYEPLYVLKGVCLYAKSTQKVKKLQVTYAFRRDNFIRWSGDCSISQPDATFELLATNISGYDVPFDSTTYNLDIEYAGELFSTGDVRIVFLLIFAVYGR
ncbi:MAG: hypothetical protein QXT84_02015 [Candidatus Bathyarchaeia archaeon]